MIRPTFLLLVTLAFISTTLTTSQRLGAQQISERGPSESAAIVDNTTTFQAKDDIDVAVMSALADFKRSVETFDFARLQARLGDDFEFRMATNREEAVVISRADFLRARETWQKIDKPTLELRYHVTGIIRGDDARHASVIALSSYRSKYFDPIFVEKLVLQKVAEGWRVTRQQLVPLSPAQFDESNIQFYIAAPPAFGPLSDYGSLARAFEVETSAGRPDRAIERHQQNAVRSFPIKKLASYVYVFRQPPPVGATITIDRLYTRGSFRDAHRSTFVVSRVTGFYAIQLENHWTGGSGHFLTTVYVDDKQALKKQLRIE